jgi:hypothetical protein
VDPDEDGEGNRLAIRVVGEVDLVWYRDVEVETFEFIHFFCGPLAFFCRESNVSYE